MITATLAVVPPVNRAGWPFIAIAFAVAVLLGLLWSPLFWIFLLVTVAVALFFRDPIRVTPTAPTLVVSPADGRIVEVGRKVPPAELGLGVEPLPHVAIFLSVLDVHVNRVPIAGDVLRVAYRPGKFLNADLDKASEENERNGVVIESAAGKVGVVQIAGLIARRIVCTVKAGDRVGPGERFGLIRFGSRLEVFMPADTEPVVGIGQYALAGETVLADLAPAAAGPHAARRYFVTG